MKKQTLTLASSLLALLALNSCQQTRQIYHPDGTRVTGLDQADMNTSNTSSNSGTYSTTGPVAGGHSDGGQFVEVDTTEINNGAETEFKDPNITDITDSALNGTAVTGHPFDNPVYFAYNKADISSAEHEKLNHLAKYLADNPTYQLTISGHADERGSEEYNRALSERRALAVKKYVVSVNGALENRISTVGFGEEKPLDTTNSPEAHAKNRRAGFDFHIKN